MSDHDDPEAHADAEMARRLCADISPILAGHPPRVQGAVLADLLAMWLAGHMASTRKATDAVRDAILAMHIDVVRKLIPINADQIRKRLS